VDTSEKKRQNQSQMGFDFASLNILKSIKNEQIEGDFKSLIAFERYSIPSDGIEIKLESAYPPINSSRWCYFFRMFAIYTLLSQLQQLEP